MTPLVRVVGAREPEQLFISIEDIPLVFSDLRRSLPELAAELRGKWPVETVYIEEQKPRAKNPIDPAQIIPAACIGLVVVFGSAVLKAAGTKIGDAIGDEITPFVRRWVKAHFETLNKNKPRINSRKQRKRLPRPARRHL